ncbi:AAA family ATPase [Empedobacter falsenii]|uniref:AAA family ATPase n=1 Tax=Empedobacter falsenii TaxID=343874 RepID=UPI001C8D3270|nr:AAA family ATPase [Empedobacter falsenii]MBY0067836.1 AAA family ATPase [Empedobacter falsenii]
MEENSTLEEQIVTLETEVNKFADGLSYWAKFLAEKILSGNDISDNDIETSHSYLLEHLKLIDETSKPEISIDYNTGNSGDYKSDLLLTKLENVEGVNALIENQTIEFSPNLTIVYGANGSGKSGYVRLLKDVFYSKVPETILPNVHIDSGHKPVNAKFTFKSNNSENLIDFTNKENAEFKQFAVFDGNSVLKHLENKNEFEFRPAGLSFFAEYTNAIIRVEQKLNTYIQAKQTGYTTNDLSALFDGNSEIKTIVQSLNAETKIDELKKYSPFSEEDKTQKEIIQKKYDELFLAFKGKEKEIKSFESIKGLLIQNKQAIEKLNQFFTTEGIEKVKTAISDCVSKETIAKAEGIENFKTDKIENVGTTEWKNFIISAEEFAKIQKSENIVYPENGDNCLLCQQSLSEEAQKLISNYWTFIKSVAEQNAKQAKEKLDKTKGNYENLNFDLFPQDNTLTVWLKEKYPNELKALTQNLSELKILGQSIIGDIQNKTINDRIEIQISVEQHTTIETAIDNSIKFLKEDKQSKELEKLLNSKTLIEHKEKFNIHFSKFETFVNNQVLIKKANEGNFRKLKKDITDTEKILSNKYFNQKYIDTFNEECQKLNGHFGIEISTTGSAGKSSRQLKLKGKRPNDVLSEGEQKVIAIADFLAEMHLSEVNKGIIFDDPVTSLDNDRKKQIAERLAFQATLKQVIIFTHDLVFFYHIKNFSKKFLNGINDSFFHHSLEKDSPFCGKVVANTSPANEGQYNKPTKAEEWLQKSKNSSGNDKIDNAKAGLSALRSSYEALAIFTVLGGTVQRFDPQIRMGRLKDIKYEKSLILEVVENHGEISDLIEGHLPSDEFGIIPSPEILEEHIERFKDLKIKLNQQ